MKGIIKMVHSVKQLKQDLMNLGIVPGDMVLMHSSYKASGDRKLVDGSLAEESGLDRRFVGI